MLVLTFLALLVWPLLIAGGALLGVAFVFIALPAGFPLALALLYFYSYMFQNDTYTKFLLVFYKLGLKNGRRPTARADMVPSMLKPKKTLTKKYVEYALNIAVPIGSEEDFYTPSDSFGLRLATWIEENAHKLPFRHHDAEFAPDEDPVAYVMQFVGDVYPKVVEEWREKCSDEAMTQMAFFGLGAHRLEALTEKDGTRCIVVKTNQLSQLPVRDGFEHYGGDAYFNFDTWRVEKIVIQNQGNLFDEEFTTVRPGDEGWTYAKFRWRSSLFTLVTLVDHLYGVHLQVANAVAIASREQLSPGNPLRRFLTPFTFRTITINNNARNNLVNPKSMGPRCFSLTDRGVDMAFAAAPSLLPSGLAEAKKYSDDPCKYYRALLDRGWFIENVVKPQLGGKLTPYYEQALGYWNATRQFVEGYMRSYWSGPAALSKDLEVFRFTMQTLSLLETVTVNKLASAENMCPEHGSRYRDPELMWEVLINLLARYIDVVTANHEQVGNVQIYAQDSSFCAFSWKKGKLAATKQAAVCAAVLMSFTSTPMPSLMKKSEQDDWSFLFVDKWTSANVKNSKEKAVNAYNEFQEELVKLSKAADAYNEAALAEHAQFPYNFGIWSQNPKYLESSVSV